MEKIKIGLVDDHPIFLDGITSSLKKNCEYEIVFSETSAKRVIDYHLRRGNIPDLLITDISMPEMTGFEFVKKLKKTCPKTKVLILSTYPNIKSHETIDGHITKESSLNDLEETIEKIVLFGEKVFTQNDNNFEFNNTLLSKREKEIIKLISIGLTSDQISEKLFISSYTVNTHTKNIFRKLGIHTNAELVKKGVYLGVIK